VYKVEIQANNFQLLTTLGHIPYIFVTITLLYHKDPISNSCLEELVIQKKQTGKTLNNEFNMICYLRGKRAYNINRLKQNCTVTRKRSNPIPEETKFHFITHD